MSSPTSPTAGNAPPTSDRAQDLSFADQQELLAFIEKRNWFEQKLDSLKALAPVYPFVHPFLVPDPKSTAGYVRAGADTSPWRLPDRAQLSAWVSERNALEDEVARFDDGDMERMKERTRQMTRVPLTQPSTDLVEVTLDLILLIDQLLTVLRKRGAVLELTSLRLQWDDLRHEVSRESESVNAEIQYFVSESQAWIPGAPSVERLERRSSSRLHTRPPAAQHSSSDSTSEAGGAPVPLPNSPAAPLATLPAASLTTPPTSPSRSPKARRGPPSPTKLSGGPKSSLHLSILRSQLVGLQSRQRNFTITLVKRSSAILDKMIDAAGRLDGLGGITGPLAENEKIHGAVPEELIELQDAIEENANAMNDIVKWCGEFETQCRQAHQHYMSSLQAQHIAGEVLVELEKALTFPASSTQHAALAKQYAEATRALPPVIDATFPRPSHPEFPSKDLHNEELVRALQATRETAQADVDLVGKALAFYSGMVKAREALLAQHQRVQTLRTQLAETVDRLERGTASVPRPDLEEIARNGGNCSGWLQCAAGWISTGDEVVRSATDTHQSTLLAAMLYRKALASAPMAVKQYLPPGGVQDDLGPVVDDNASDLITLARRCAELTKTTRTAAEALPIVLCIRQDSEEIDEDASSLYDNIVLAINQSVWSRSAGEMPPVQFDDEVTKLSARFKDMESDLQRLKSIAPSASISQPLVDKVTGVRDRLTTANQALKTLGSVSDQARLVRTVQAEAEQLIKDIDNTRETVPTNKDTRAMTSAVTALRQRVEAWKDTLTQRVIFVSDDPPSLERATSRERSDGAPLTPPLTPVHGFPAQSSTMPDLASIDGRVRTELNRQSARVSSALGHLVAIVEEAAFERWSAPVVKATAELETATAALGTVMVGLTSHMDKIKATEGEERKTLTEEAQKVARETLPEPVIEVQQCIAALNNALGSAASPGSDMHRAADVFSSADVAREAGLAAIAETEEWQKAVTRLSLEAEVKLQKAKALLLQKKAQEKSQTRQLSSRASSTTLEATRELTEKLDMLDLENIVRPSPVALRTTPKHRRLPSSAMAKKIASSFTNINASARTLAEQKKGTQSPEVETLMSKLKRAAALVPELDGLGTVADASSACDRAFSRLIDAIDSKDKAKIRSAERDAERTIVAFKKAARSYKLDQRVMDEQKRIMRAWDDLRGEADDLPPLSYTPTGGSGNGSTAGSIRRSASRTSLSSLVSNSTTASHSSLTSDTTVKGIRKRTSRLSGSSAKVLGATRNVSMPPPEVPQQLAVAEQRPRIASAGETPSKPPKREVSQLVQTPLTKRAIEHRDSVFTPRTRTSSTVSRTPSSASRLRPTIPQPFSFTISGGLTRSASATTSLSELATPTRARGPRLSAPPETPTLGEKTLNAKPSKRRLLQATKLDEAVAKVLDTLDVDVPVVPIGRDTPEQWHDESGRYWIGTGSKARLCFCRILRSRTVMVRVGGGWVELSRYLLDRFADVLAESAESVPRRETMSMSPPDWRRVPLAITSATISATQSLSATIRSEGSLPPRTPIRKPLPTFDPNATSPLEIVTPDRQPSLSPQSQSSPLVPLQFIRKASESPSVREREREAIRLHPAIPTALREGSVPRE